MMKRIGVALVLIAGVSLLVTGCVLPNSGTVRVRNEMTESRVITALYIYKLGSPRSTSVASDIDPNETHTEYGVAPGDYVIEADVNYGAYTAVETLTVEDGTFHVVWISDTDIL